MTVDQRIVGASELVEHPRSTRPSTAARRVVAEIPAGLPAALDDAAGSIPSADGFTIA